MIPCFITLVDFDSKFRLILLFSVTPCIWIFSADPLEILARGRGCGAGRDFSGLECAGRKFVRQVRKVIEDREGPTPIAKDVTHMNLPGYLPKCFVHGTESTGYRVYFNTGSSGAVPPASWTSAHRAICKKGSSVICLKETLKLPTFIWGKKSQIWVGGVMWSQTLINHCVYGIFHQNIRLNVHFCRTFSVNSR